MCAFFNVYSYLFKYVACLLLVIGIYTFLHWFLAVPLLYSHFYECCHEKWFKNWIGWFLTIAFACWFGVLIFIILVWFCLRLCNVRHLNESNTRLTEKEKEKNSKGETTESTKSVTFEKNKINVSNGTFENTESNKKITVGLPHLDLEESFTVLQMNNHQHLESSVPNAEIFKSVSKEESSHYDQNEFHEPSETTPDEIPPKTPREIFFKDLIEAASKSQSYFDFDPEKISEDVKKISKLKKSLENSTDDRRFAEEKNFFVGSHEEKENLTTEVLINLNEKGLVVDEPAVLGRFQILKE